MKVIAKIDNKVSNQHFFNVLNEINIDSNSINIKVYEKAVINPATKSYVTILTGIGIQNPDILVKGSDIPNSHPFVANELFFLLDEKTWTLDDMRSYRNWADYSYWTFNVIANELEFYPINLFAELSTVKIDVEKAYWKKNRVMSVVRVFVPYTSILSFDECLFRLPITGPSIAGNIVPMIEMLEEDVSVPYWKNFFAPRLVLSCDATQIKADGYATINVQMIQPPTVSTDIVKKPAKVYLEAVNGYLPKTRIDLVDGVGSFKIMALGLDAGDKLIARAGFKYFSNLVSIELNVV